MGYAVGLMSRPVARLFHAVVIVGASLAGCDAASEREEGPTPAAAPTSAAVPGQPTPTASPEATAGAAPDTEPVQPATARLDTSSDGGADDQVDAATSGDLAADAPPRPARSAMRARPAPTMAAPESPRGDACPPGSERPFPPCYFIL